MTVWMMLASEKRKYPDNSGSLLAMAEQSSDGSCLSLVKSSARSQPMSQTLQTLLGFHLGFPLA